MKEIYDIKDKKQKEKLLFFIKTDKAFRIEFFRKRLYSFGLYYFGHLLNTKRADFHKQICLDLLDDKNLLLIAFRGAGKSLWTFIDLIHTIVYKRANFILYFSYEQRLSAAKLFDVIVALKTNYNLINDFGEMFPGIETKKEDGLQKKSVSEFITSNKIKVKSMSIGTTARGLLYINNDGAFRIDKIILDDIDTIDSVRNPEIIDKNEQFILNEVFGRVDNNCKIVFLGNIIGNDGLVPRFKMRVLTNKNWILRQIPVIENGKITWDKFVQTDEEAEEFKKKGIIKISLETKKREEGEEAYNANYLLIPSVKFGNPVFNLQIITNLKALEYNEDLEYKDLRIYRKPELCVIGIDTSLGNGGDYTAIIVRNYDYKLLATYKGQVGPEMIVNIVDRLYKLGYKGKIIPENNSIGLATIQKIQEIPYLKAKLHYETSIDKITNKPSMKYGFNTNGKTRPLIIQKMKELINNHILNEFDEREKQEILNFYYNQQGKEEALQGSNDDLIMADAICIFGLNSPRGYYFV